MKHRGGFIHRFKGNVLEIWYGTPDDPESDLVLAIDVALVDSLMAAINAATRKK